MDRDDLWFLVRAASVGLSVYHGYKRNDSLGWALLWGASGYVLPVVTPAVAFAQGFGVSGEFSNFRTFPA